MSIRVQAALTAMTFVVAGLYGIVHEATTRHVRCAEHGELIHGESPIEDAGPARGAVVGEQPARDAVVGEQSGGTTRGHEHCSLTSATRVSRVMPRPPAIVPALIAIGDAGVPTSLAGGAQRSCLYRTAPKTSPPV